MIYESSGHMTALEKESFDLGYMKGRWDMFETLSGLEYGKQCYFLQDDGTVYSRRSCEYMSMGDAIKEFCDSQEYGW